MFERFSFFDWFGFLRRKYAYWVQAGTIPIVASIEDDKTIQFKGLSEVKWTLLGKLVKQIQTKIRHHF